MYTPDQIPGPEAILTCAGDPVPGYVPFCLLLLFLSLFAGFLLGFLLFLVVLTGFLCDNDFSE